MSFAKHIAPEPSPLDEDREAGSGDEGPQQRIIEIDVTNGERPERVDQYLARMLPNSSRSKIQQGIEEGAVYLNGKVLSRPSYKIKGGDHFRLIIPRPPLLEAKAEEIPLEIIYEDEDLLIINKAAGMVVHPAFGSPNGTLVNALLHHLEDFSASHHAGDPLRPGIVHRLDKDTSGLLVVAKNEHASRDLSQQFFHHTAHRMYWAIVWGRPKQRFATITTQIIRSPKDRKKFVAAEEGGKTAVTDYVLLDELPGFSLLELRLKTGRTHQIRVHMQHLGHPIFGDAVYGGKTLHVVRTDVPHFRQWADNLLLRLPRQALHARSLRLQHPRTKELMEWSAPLPDDMSFVLEEMRRMGVLLGERNPVETPMRS